MALLYLSKETKWQIQRQCVQVLRANCSRGRTTSRQARATHLKPPCILQVVVWVRGLPPIQQPMKSQTHQARDTQRGALQLPMQPHQQQMEQRHIGHPRVISHGLL